MLEPRGELHIHTAFRQPLHEAPGHYFNAAEFSIHEWFKDFENVKYHLGTRATRRIGNLPLAEAALFWRRPQAWNQAAHEVFLRLPKAAKPPIAAGFDRRVRKPVG